MSASPHVFEVTAASFAEAVLQASHRQPVLVDFWASWCQPCHMLMPVLEHVVEDLQGAVRLAKVDTDAEQALAAELGIRSLPTVRLYRDGRAVDEFQGAQPEQVVRRFLAAHLPRPGDEARAAAAAAREAGEPERALTLLREAFTRHPDDLQLGLELAATLLALAEAEEAERVLDGLQAEDGAQEALLARLRAQAGFARRAAEIAEPSALEQRLQADPRDDEATHRLAVLRVAQGRFEEAMELLLALLARNRAYGDDAARRELLAVFDLLGAASPLVREYRRRMASTLH